MKFIIANSQFRLYDSDNGVTTNLSGGGVTTTSGWPDILLDVKRWRVLLTRWEYLWSYTVGENEQLSEYRTNSEDIYSMAVHPIDGTVWAGGQYNNANQDYIRFYSADLSQVTYPVLTPDINDNVIGLQFVNKYLIVQTYGNRILVYDTETLIRTQEVDLNGWTTGDAYYTGIRLSRDKKYLLYYHPRSDNVDNAVRIFSVNENSGFITSTWTDPTDILDVPVSGCFTTDSQVFVLGYRFSTNHPARLAVRRLDPNTGAWNKETLDFGVSPPTHDEVWAVCPHPRDPNTFFYSADNRGIREMTYNPITETWEYVGELTNSNSASSRMYDMLVMDSPEATLVTGAINHAVTIADGDGRFPIAVTGQKASTIPVSQMDAEASPRQKVLANMEASYAFPEFFIEELKQGIEHIAVSSTFFTDDGSSVGFGSIENFSDVFSATDASVMAIAIHFREAFAIAGEGGTNISTSIEVDDAIAMLDDFKIYHILILASAFGLDSTENIDHYQVLSFLSSITAESSSTNTARFTANFAAAFTLLDFINYGADLSFVSALDLTTAYTNKLNYLINGASAHIIEDSHAINVRVEMAFLSSGVLLDSLETQGRFSEDFSDAIEGLSVFRIGDDVYEGWVLNVDKETDTQAFSKYLKYSFNSIVQLKGKIYGASESGLYLLEGDTDDGEPIPAAIRTGLMDLGARQIKDAKNFYLGYTGDGQLVLKALSLQGGKRREDWYLVRQSASDGFRTGRAKIGRGLRSTYWQFELANVEGSDFDIDGVTLEYQVLSRRIRK